MTDEQDELTRTAVHESSHQVLAHAFGYRLGAITVTPGKQRRGCSAAWAPPVPVALDADAEAPFPLWPDAVRRHFETQVMVSLAGDLGEFLLAPRSDRVGPVAAPVVDIETLPVMSENERRWAVRVVDEGDPEDDSDAAHVATALKTAHGQDVMSAAAHRVFLEAQTGELILLHAAAIERVAMVAAEVGMLSGEAIVALLARPKLGLVASCP